MTFMTFAIDLFYVHTPGSSWVEVNINVPLPSMSDKTHTSVEGAQRCGRDKS